MSGRKKILWLVSWYPNKYDAFDGDFIQRHARAAALYNDIYVLYIKAFEQQAKKEEEIKLCDGITEHRIYLPKKPGLVGKLKSMIEWQRNYKKEVSDSYPLECWRHRTLGTKNVYYSLRGDRALGHL